MIPHIRQHHNFTNFVYMYLNNQEQNYYYINFYEMNCFFHLRSISQVSTLVYCNICCGSVSNNVILPIILLQPFWLWFAAYQIVVSFCRYSTLWYRGQFVSGNVILPWNLYTNVRLHTCSTAYIFELGTIRYQIFYDIIFPKQLEDATVGIRSRRT